MANYSEEDIIIKLKHNSELNPFHSSYNSEKLKNLIFNLTSDKFQFSVFLDGFLRIVPCMALFMNNLKQDLNNLLTQCKLSNDQIIQLSVALVNHYFIRKNNDIMNNLPQKLERFEDMNFIYSDFVQKLEGTVSTNNMLINYINSYKRSDSNEKSSNSNIYSILQKINVMFQIVYLYKDFYEKCLFEQYIIDTKCLPLMLKASISDDRFSVSQLVSRIRELKYKFNFCMFLENNKDLKSLMLLKFNSKIKLQKIKKIIIKNHTVSIELEHNDVITNSQNEYCQLCSNIMPFYQYMYHEKEIASLIEDYLIMYSKLKELFNAICKFSDISDLKNFKNLEHIPTKIKKSTLIDYMLNVTNFERKTIIIFLSTLEMQNSINFFKYPLYIYGEYYIFHLLTSTASIILNNIDNWIEKNDYNLNVRGKIFEKYIKANVRTILKDKKYKYNLCDSSMFRAVDNTKEEIDLIVEFEKIVLIAECKSMKYPIEHRDVDNSRKRVLEGVEQIIRKKTFIEKNPEIFLSYNLNIQDKEIVPLVITSIPCFTGWVVKNVPVIDYELFFNYIDTGCLSEGSLDGFKYKKTGQKDYYINQDDFEENFNEFFHNPLPVQDISNLCVKKYRRIINDKYMYENLNPKLYIQEYTRQDLK